MGRSKKPITKEILKDIKIKDKIRKIIEENSELDNKQIAELLKTSIPKVRAVRYWMQFKNTEKNSSYTNVDGIKKQSAREKIISCIESSGINDGKILTLPFSTCEIERQIISKFRNKFHFIACEREEDVYYKMLNTIAENRLTMSTHFGNIEDKIYSSKENEYSHLILDYCGQISTFQNELDYVFRNNIIRIGGTIAITLCKRGEIKGELGDKINALADNLIPKEQIQSYAIKTFFSQYVGKTYKMETYLEYHDDGKSPMVLVTLKRLL